MLPRATKTALNAAAWLLLVASSYTSGWPVDGAAFAAKGYDWLAYLPSNDMHPTNYFPSVAGMGLLVALEFLPVTHRLFNTRFALYLGEISYGLYLIHFLVIKSFLASGIMLELRELDFSFLAAWRVKFVLAMVLSIWFGDVYARLVDKPAVRFSHWITKKFGV